MDVSIATWWWVATGMAIAAELATGTFYLLMIGLGLGAGAVAALFEVSVAAQIVVASVVGGGATAIWHWSRRRQPPAAAARENRDVHLDIGERVTVTAWAGDRTARVTYRGSEWTARLAPGVAPVNGEHRVVAMENNWLVLMPAVPP